MEAESVEVAESVKLLKNGKPVARQCERCDAAIEYPRRVCPECKANRRKMYKRAYERLYIRSSRHKERRWLRLAKIRHANLIDEARKLSFDIAKMSERINSRKPEPIIVGKIDEFD